jgi:hypothetical protein
MMKKLVFAACVLLFLRACAPKPKPGFHVPEGAILAVADFTQPRHMGELLAGYIPEDQPLADPEDLAVLDARLQDALHRRLGRNFMGHVLTGQCREIVDQDIRSSRVSAFDYWLRVGRCLSADYILVPQVLEWQERRGGEWGATGSAKVVLDMFLISVTDESVQRFHFDETQLALSENILTAPSFVRRGGKWITARQMAEEAMELGLEELGL